MPPYFTFLLTFFALPLTLLLAFRREALRFPRTTATSLLGIIVIGGFWDWLSVKTGVWRYDSADTFGVWFAGLPIEEFVGFYFLGGLFITAVILTILRWRR